MAIMLAAERAGSGNEETADCQKFPCYALLRVTPVIEKALQKVNQSSRSKI